MLNRDQVQALYRMCSQGEREEVRGWITALELGDIGLHELVVTITGLYEAKLGGGGTTDLFAGADFDVDMTAVPDFEPEETPGFEPEEPSLFMVPDAVQAKIDQRRAAEERRYP